MSNTVVLLAGMLPLYIIRFSIAGIPTTLFEAAVLATTFVCACIPRTRRQLWTAIQAIPKNKLILIGLFLLAAVISTPISPVVRNSLGILKGWVVTPMLFGLLVHAAQHKALRVRERIILALILSGLVVALFGLSQIDGFNRIRSLYDVPNSLALFLVPITVLAVWIGTRNRNRFYQYAAIPMLGAIVTTQSLGAVVAALGTFLFGILTAGQRSRPLHIVIVGCILLAAIVFTLSGRFSYLLLPFTQPGTTNSITVRLQLWDIGTNLIKKHPILGIGLGQFEPNYQRELHVRLAERVNTAKGYKIQPEFVFRDPHNWIISFWLNVGMLGLLSFGALNYLLIKRWQEARASNDMQSQGVILAIISVAIFGLVDTVYWKNDLAALWWALAALSGLNIPSCRKVIKPPL